MYSKTTRLQIIGQIQTFIVKRNQKEEQKGRLNFVSIMNGVWSEFTYTGGRGK